VSTPSPARTEIFGYPVHLLLANQAVAMAETAIQQGETLQVVTLNPEMMMQGDQDPELGRILRSAELALPDGAGLVWALKRYGHQVTRLPGIEFSENLLQKAAERDWPVAIIGAAPDVLALAVQNLQEKYPKLRIAYSHHGFFKPGAEEAQVVQDCAAAKPRVVLAALGVPRQEKWIDQYRASFSGAVLVGIGGSLDVWSGKTLRAPSLMRRLNLEWLYRISTQPWRIKRIYKTLPMFVVKVLLSRGSV
jgi:N-acetylglucosaminyldiphosphoundecaprenol N-acetyl-beta-D-mannosaminyltransferase